ncbi:MAG: sulfurtransferase-like selenium metabolism protein YedF [Syntrophomonadaceae bacterium]|nr:sulfurtransferase-like selenium metabolism protein YedF [Syntrophomonadaceae bacterium]
MREVDARGLACPQPVILTRKTWLESSAEPLLVRVDNPIARDNVCKLAQSLGLFTEVTENGTEFQILINKGESAGNQENQPSNALIHEQPLTSLASSGCGCLPGAETGIVILIKDDVLGAGNRELGQALMKSFLYTLRELPEGIKALIFLNRGVYLTCEGSDSLEHLEYLANEGIEIYSCGTCLNFFNLQDQLKVGVITNMYSILEIIKGASKVIAL